MSISILYEDAALAVCVKPRGVLSQAGAEGEASMLTLLSAQLGTAVFPVHRLDKPVGGLMVYARTAEAAGFFGREIQAGKLKKEYLAALRGLPTEEAGVLEDLLLHDSGKNKSYVVKRMRRGVKKAKLSYRVLAREEGQSLVQVRLFTGRTHQIRVQFASRGLPLTGDGRYGGGSGELALWSARLTFRHPKSRRVMVFSALPERLGAFAEFPPLAEME